MPISGPSSYVATTEQFEQHWLTADTKLGVGNEVVLPGAVNQAGLTSKKNELIAKRADVQSKLNNKEVARGDVELKKAALLERLVQFNDKIRAFFPGSKWLGALPNVPGQAESQSRITDPLDDASHLWQQINSDPATGAPVLLIGGYTQAMLAADLAAQKTAYSALNAALTVLKVTRVERNRIQDEIYAILKSYRQVLPTFFAKDDALVVSLPRLSPLPGSTPAGLSVTGNWNAATGQGELNWAESTDPALDHYEIRVTIGPDYDTDLESTVGSVQPGVTTFQTLEGLAASGDTASYRVYVVLTTGNESGSNTVTITRP